MAARKSSGRSMAAHKSSGRSMAAQKAARPLDGGRVGTAFNVGG
jgi:hypothetical protein